MRSIAIAVALALVGLMVIALPVAAAELTGGCTLEASAFDAQGTPLDAGAVPPGTEGTDQNAFRVGWAGRVDYRFSTGATAFQDNAWAIYVQGIPIPILRGSDDDPIDPDESREVRIGEGVPGQIVGLFYVSGFIEGNGGIDRCDGNGWVHIVGDPLATIPFWIAVLLLVLGAALLVATPYSETWDEMAEPMPPPAA